MGATKQPVRAMVNFFRAAALLLGLLPAIVTAQPQSAPPNLPDQTVYGRIGSGTGKGPAQAIPFGTLSNILAGFGGTANVRPANETSYTILSTDHVVINVNQNAIANWTLPDGITTTLINDSRNYPVEGSLTGNALVYNTGAFGFKTFAIAPLQTVVMRWDGTNYHAELSLPSHNTALGNIMNLVGYGVTTGDVSVTIGGSITAGDIVGFNYATTPATQPRHTVVGGDTTLTIAQDLYQQFCAAPQVKTFLGVDLWAASCPTGFQLPSPIIGWEQSWPNAGAVTPFLSGGATETVTAGGGGTQFVGASYIVAGSSSKVFGRAPTTGDTVFQMYIVGDTTNKIAPIDAAVPPYSILSWSISNPADGTGINGGGVGDFNITTDTNWFLGKLGVGIKPTHPFHVLGNNLGVVITDGPTFENQTAAAAGAQQASPPLRLIGQGWRTNATAQSMPVEWAINTLPVQGTATPSSTLLFSHQENSGGYSQGMSITSTGVFNAGLAYTIGGSVATAGRVIRSDGTTGGVFAQLSCADLSTACLTQITVGTTTITGGTNGRIIYDNAGVVGEAMVTGSLGSVVLSSSPAITTPVFNFTATVVNNGIGTALTDGLVIQNATAAAAGAQQASPLLHFIGQGWKTNATAASQTVDWAVFNLPVQGAANPTSQLLFDWQVNGGGYSQGMSITSGGIFNVGTAYTVGGSVATAGRVIRSDGVNGGVFAQLACADLSTPCITGNQTITLSGDVTGSGTTSITAIIASAAVTYAKIQNVTGLSVLGRSASSSGVVGELTGTASQFLAVNAAGNGVGFLTMAGDATLSGPTLTISAAAITYSKIQNVTASRLLGNPTGGAAAPSEISLGATLAFSGSALQTIAHTGDVTTSANSFVTTVAKIAGTTVSGTTGSINVVFSTSPTISGTSTSITNVGTFALRDTSAAFDLTLAATSSTALTAGRTLTLDVGNVAHTLALGTTANTITFPNNASFTVAGLSIAQTFTANQTISLANGKLVVQDTGTSFSFINVFGGGAIGGVVVGQEGTGGGGLLIGGSNAKDAVFNAGDAASKFQIGTTNVIRMTVGSSSSGGGVGIGTQTDPGSGSLQVNTTIVAPNITSDAGLTDTTLCWKNTATTGTFLKGSGTLGICLGTSGRQFKNIIAPMPPVLDRLARLPLWDYYYKPGFGDDGEHLQRGPTAQDIAQVFPDLARYDDKGDAVNYDWSALIFLQLRGMQELHDRVMYLERRQAQ